jgi:type IV pilus assembly protein PilC
MRKQNHILSPDEISLFSRQLALVIESDISLQEGLSLISIKDHDKLMNRILTGMVRDINSGLSLYTSMLKYRKEFGTFFLSMVEIGEKSGNMGNVLTQVADAYEKQNQTRKKVKSALTYPAVLSVLMLLVIIVLAVYVMPMFNEILISMGGVMPPLTRAILDVSLFVSNNVLYIITLVIMFMIIYCFIKLTPNGRKYFDKLSLRLPIQKHIVAAVSAGRFARNLALLIKSGINLIIAVDMLIPIMNNSYIEEKLEGVAEMLKKGEPPDKAIATLELFPQIIIKLFAIAYGTGHMVSVLERAAAVMDQELESRLEKLTTVVEPLLVTILSLFVGILLLSVILPVAGIINAIG